MHHNNSNHGNWLALTSSGVRQAKSDMVHTMSTTSQLSGARQQAAGRKNLLHVIYELVDHRLAVKSDSGHTLDKLPITQGTFPFDGKSRSNGLIEDKPLLHQSSLPPGQASTLVVNSLSTLSSQSDSKSSPVNVSTAASRNSHRQKRNIHMLDNIPRMVKLQNHYKDRSMVLRSNGVLQAEKYPLEDKDSK